MSYDWQIGGMNIPFTIVQANSLSFTSGTYQNNARAVWNIGMNTNPADYYFEEFLFADWISFINIGNTENLYILSQTFSNGVANFNIQIVQSVVTPAFGPSYPSGDYTGYLTHSFTVDEFYSVFRVIAWNYFPLDFLFYSFSVSNLLAAPPVSVAYGQEYLKAVLFVN